MLVGPGGAARRAIRAALTDDARVGLLEYLAACECEIVATEALARADLLPARAARRGLVVWIIDDGLVAALVRAAAIRDPARAALLACLPRIALLRAQLRRLTPAGRVMASVRTLSGSTWTLSDRRPERFTSGTASTWAWPGNGAPLRLLGGKTSSRSRSGSASRACFLVRPDGTLYWAAVQTMAFARPHFRDVLSGLDFVIKVDYPARGEVE
jgi:hypothetical protein